jgi:hypothetical protein
MSLMQFMCERLCPPSYLAVVSSWRRGPRPGDSTMGVRMASGAIAKLSKAWPSDSYLIASCVLSAPYVKAWSLSASNAIATVGGRKSWALQHHRRRGSGNAR